MGTQFRTPQFGATVATATTIANSTPVSVTTHDGIYVVTRNASTNTAPSGVTDSAGNTYVRLTPDCVASDGNNGSLTHWFCKDATGGSLTVTATWGSSVTSRGIAVVPCYGHDTSATPVAIAQEQDSPATTTDAVSSSNLTPAAAPGALVGFTFNNYNHHSNIGTGFTSISADPGDIWLVGAGGCIDVEQKSFSTTSAVAATFTLATAGGNNATLAIAIKDAASGAPKLRGLLVALMLMGVVSFASASGGGGGSASYTINWAADAYKADGSTIGGALVGFKVYGSQTRQNLSPTLLATVANPASTGTTLTGLASGAWYFSVTGYTSNAESDPFTSISVTL